ncbi:hypothetical protein BKA66DRAFT_421876, partial [Pyrenochaeta sp. MPI-SDFR-AT-0127]
HDGWVMAAWGRINGVRDDQIVRLVLFLGDLKTSFAKSHAPEVRVTDRNG